MAVLVERWERELPEAQIRARIRALAKGWIAEAPQEAKKRSEVWNASQIWLTVRDGGATRGLASRDAVAKGDQREFSSRFLALAEAAREETVTRIALFGFVPAARVFAASDRAAVLAAGDRAAPTVFASFGEATWDVDRLLAGGGDPPATPAGPRLPPRNARQLARLREIALFSVESGEEPTDEEIARAVRWLVAIALAQRRDAFDAFAATRASAREISGIRKRAKRLQLGPALARFGDACSKILLPDQKM